MKKGQNFNANGRYSLHDEFIGDEEYTFDTKFENDDENKKRDNKKNKILEEIKNLRTLFNLNPIRMTKYNKLYFVCLVISLLLIIPSIFIVHSISCFISCVICSMISFFAWNKLEYIYECINEDKLIWENLKNVERAFLKTSKLVKFYKNSEILFKISHKIILITLIFCILLNIIFLKSAPYFLQNLILPISLLINLLSLHICFLKEDVEIGIDTNLNLEDNLNFNFYKIITILSIILFVITNTISLATVKRLNTRFMLIFIALLTNTIYIFFRKKKITNNFRL